MKNKAITITVDKELKDLLPKLSHDEYDRLEKDIITNGCKMPLAYWENNSKKIILDGHNRFAICTQNHIAFESISIPEVKSRQDAKIWILSNQIARRNLDRLTRIKLALQLKDLWSERARKNKGHGQTAPGKSLCQNSVKAIPISTNKELSNIAGVSTDTIARADRIFKAATEDQKKRLETGESSINKIYNEVIQRKSHLSDDVERFLKRFKWAVQKDIVPIGQKLIDLVDTLNEDQKNEASNILDELWQFLNEMSVKFRKFKDQRIHP